MLINQLINDLFKRWSWMWNGRWQSAAATVWFQFNFLWVFQVAMITGSELDNDSINDKIAIANGHHHLSL